MEGFAQVTALLRGLIKKGHSFCGHQNATEHSSKPEQYALRRYSNGTLRFTSRPQGLAVTLKQYDPQARQGRPVIYRSRALTDTKTRYSQLEKEPKAIEWGVLTNQIYLYGLTDTFEIDASQTVSVPVCQPKGHRPP